MIIIDCAQNSPEWYAARLGIPTASKFDKIITPTGDQSKQWEAYAHEILAEEIVGHAIEGYRSADMEEGQRREDESVSYYEMQRDVTTERVGFVLNDRKTWGCSPDRLIGADGLLELKNPKHNTQTAYLLDESEVNKLAREYWPQIQGQLLITERKWCDVMSYYPEMPPVIVRVGRDQPYITALFGLLENFTVKLDAKRQKLIKLGHLKPKDDPARMLRAG